jgi:hypothetical protein
MIPAIPLILIRPFLARIATLAGEKIHGSAKAAEPHRAILARSEKDHTAHHLVGSV